MYVLMCPCIRDPSLRAPGITDEADLLHFSRARARCTRYGIEVVTLPCPETIYLGKDRKPGSFLERLNTPEFFRLLDDLEEGVRKEVRERGNPLCIIGVNSSPTCGSTTTHYGCQDPGGSSKRPGRGVFLDRFPEIPVIDVSIFSRYRVYLAAPLFSDAERQFNRQLARMLESHFFQVYLPQEAGDDSHDRGREEHRKIFESNLKALAESDMLVAVIEGADADSGTSWEMGYAFGHGIPVYSVRTDFRIAGQHELVNLMLEQSSVIVRNVGDLPRVLNSPIQ